MIVNSGQASVTGKVHDNTSRCVMYELYWQVRYSTTYLKYHIYHILIKYVGMTEIFTEALFSIILPYWRITICNLINIILRILIIINQYLFSYLQFITYH